MLHIKPKFYITAYFIFALLSITSCIQEHNFLVQDFNPVSNFEPNADTINLQMDLNGALTNGIRLPSENSDNKYFEVSFKIKNTSNEPKKYSYKIYYQNESYKHTEYIKIGPFKKYNKKSSENFYGSWEDTGIGFKTTPVIPNDNNYYEIKDSICIVGNPRNESKYFGGPLVNSYISSDEINKYCDIIKESDSWMEQIREKAKANNITIQKQLIEDAKWTINKDRVQGNENNRWKRNPRTGVYSFLAVVTEDDNLKNIPENIQDITLKDSAKGNYLNPFYYFLHKNSKSKEYIAVTAQKKVKSKVSIDLTKGIYYDPTNFNTDSLEKDTSKFCGYTDDVFQSANLEQFFHNINKNYKMMNVPVVSDVINDNYTQEEYQHNAENHNESTRIAVPIEISNHPGSTVGFDTLNKAVFLKNPGNSETSFRKENTGVKTRHGFTYGKFRAKIQFPEIINSEYVWNGLTCAFWLIYQPGDWNKRCACDDGYNPINKKNPKNEVPPTEDYSEIDIEIVKTSKYWPKSSYGFFQNKPYDDALNDNVIISCTNWDLACHDPKNFNVGVESLTYQDQEFFLHRWDHWYKALTLKTEYPQELTLGKPFYYEIEWKPNEIIWRIGENKNNMHVIGYMNEHSTKIPNNQMVAVITQEYHDESWWPTAPFGQNNIPFPKNDIKGYVYEIEIE